MSCQQCLRQIAYVGVPEPAKSVRYNLARANWASCHTHLYPCLLHFSANFRGDWYVLWSLCKLCVCVCVYICVYFVFCESWISEPVTGSPFWIPPNSLAKVACSAAIVCPPPTDSFCGFFVGRLRLLLLTGNQQHARENTTAYSNTFPFLCFPFFYMFWITIELADWQTDTGRRSLFLRLASAHAKKVSIKFINSENIIIKNVR